MILSCDILMVSYFCGCVSSLLTDDSLLDRIDEEEGLSSSAFKLDVEWIFSVSEETPKLLLNVSVKIRFDKGLLLSPLLSVVLFVDGSETPVIESWSNIVVFGRNSCSVLGVLYGQIISWLVSFTLE